MKPLILGHRRHLKLEGIGAISSERKKVANLQSDVPSTSNAIDSLGLAFEGPGVIGLFAHSRAPMPPQNANVGASGRGIPTAPTPEQLPPPAIPHTDGSIEDTHLSNTGGAAPPVLLAFNRPNARQRNPSPLDLSGIKSGPGNASPFNNSKALVARTNASGPEERDFRTLRRKNSGIERGSGPSGGDASSLFPSVVPQTTTPVLPAAVSARGPQRDKFVANAGEFSPRPVRVQPVAKVAGKKAMSAGTRRRPSNLCETADEFDLFNPFPQKKAINIPIIVGDGQGWWGEAPPRQSKSDAWAKDEVTGPVAPQAEDSVFAMSARERPVAPSSADNGAARFRRMSVG